MKTDAEIHKHQSVYLTFQKYCIFVEVTIYRRPLIGRDSHTGHDTHRDSEFFIFKMPDVYNCNQFCRWKTQTLPVMMSLKYLQKSAGKFIRHVCHRSVFEARYDWLRPLVSLAGSIVRASMVMKPSGLHRNTIIHLFQNHNVVIMHLFKNV